MFTETTESILMEQKTKCVEGWTDWISESIPDSVKSTKSSKPYSVEKEGIPTILQMVEKLYDYLFIYNIILCHKFCILAKS